MIVPVAVTWEPAHHSIDHRRTAERGPAWVVHAKQLRSIRCTLLADPILALRSKPGQMAVVIISRITIRVVLDVEVPCDGGRVDAESLRRARVTRFQNQHRVARFGEIRRHNAASWSTADDDIVVFGVNLHGGRSSADCACEGHRQRHGAAKAAKQSASMGRSHLVGVSRTLAALGLRIATAERESYPNSPGTRRRRPGSYTYL